MKVIEEHGKPGLATVYVAKTEQGLVEFTQALDRPLPKEKKFVIIVSTLYGCPVNCLMCDAGKEYHGRVSKEDILAQINHVIQKNFPEGINCEKLKIHFSRVGEPAYNIDVLEAIKELPPQAMPCVSTIAPATQTEFFEELLKVKEQRKSFQLQFSIHTTDAKKRDEVIPVKKWSFDEINEYGERFVKEGDRKVTLNFATIKGNAIDPKTINKHFNPKKFLVKVTPVNPNESVKEHGLESFVDPEKPEVKELFQELEENGFETILSIGDLEENKVKSNCGQILNRVRKNESD